MRTDRHICVVPYIEGGDAAETAFDIENSPGDELTTRARTAIFNARNFLLTEQHSDGHFSGRVEGTDLPESEFVLLSAFLGTETSCNARQSAAYVRSQQLSDGGWEAFHGGGVDVSTSVRAYFALKLTGGDPNAEEMRRACRAIRAAGGVEAVDEVTSWYLVLLGQVPYEACRKLSTRGPLVAPLEIVRAVKPCRRISPAMGIRELSASTTADAGMSGIEEVDHWVPLRSTGAVRRLRDSVRSLYERHSRRPQSKRAVVQAEQSVISRLLAPASTSLCFREIVWSIVALKSLGYKDDSTAMAGAQVQLDGHLYTQDDRLRVEPMKSPVLDTAIALAALSASGVEAANGAVSRAARWLLARRVPDAESQTTRGPAMAARVPVGWNGDASAEQAADVGVTALVAKVLRTSFEPASTESDALPPVLSVVSQADAEQRADDDGWIAILGETVDALTWTQSWLLGSQQEDGGWRAAPKRRSVFPTTWIKPARPLDSGQLNAVENTAHVLSALGCLGRHAGDGQVKRAVSWLRNRQHPDGSWRGTRSASAVRDTATVLAGLTETGLPSDDATIVVAVNWLLVHQHSSGGWGDQIPASPELDSASVTHTAWALLGLFAAGRHDHPAAESGIRFLLDRQQSDGNWNEPDFTDRASGISSTEQGQYRVRRQLLPVCDALMALAAWAKAHRQDASESPLATSDIDRCVAPVA